MATSVVLAGAGQHTPCVAASPLPLPCYTVPCRTPLPCHTPSPRYKHTLTELHPSCQGLAGKMLGGSAAEVKAALKKAMWNPEPDAPRA